MLHSGPGSLQHEEIGRYRLGRLYSESFSGVPYESDITSPIGVGRNDSFNLYTPDPGGPQKTLRLLVLLHETAHFVHDLSLGTCMEIDYLTDAAMGALIQVLQMSPELCCPILRNNKENSRLRRIENISTILDFLEERESLANDLLAKPADLQQYATALNPVFRNFAAQLDGLSGLSLLEGLVAGKTLVAMAIRAKDDDDVAYLTVYRDW